MELFWGFTIITTAYILVTYVFYKAWVSLFDETSETLNTYMKIISIILGILWPITSPILPIATFIILFNKVTK